VTTVTLDIGPNDLLHALGKFKAEAKGFIEATKLTPIAKAAIGKKLKPVGEKAVEAKLKVVAEEYINGKIAEQVYIKCSEKAYVENGESFEEPGFAEKREACLASEGKKLGEEYYAENKAKLEKEGEKAAGEYYFANKAKLEKEGEEAATFYFLTHRGCVKVATPKTGQFKNSLCTEPEKEGEYTISAAAACVPNTLALKGGYNDAACTEPKTEAEGAGAYIALEKEGKEAAEAYANEPENAFQLNKEGEKFVSKKIEENVEGIFHQITSNVGGIVYAIRNAGTLGLLGGKAINYTGKITFQAQYDPFGKLFHFAYEGIAFVAANGGAGSFTKPGPYEEVSGRCEPPGALPEEKEANGAKTIKEEEEKIAEGCIARDVVPSSPGLTVTIDRAVNVEALKEGAACTTSPVFQFNSGNTISEASEIERLGLWTNMLTTTKTNGKYDGPDIHPTPVGYTQLAEEMNKAKGKCHKEKLPGF